MNAQTTFEHYETEADLVPTLSTLGEWCELNGLDTGETLAELRGCGEMLLGGGAAPAYIVHVVSGVCIGRWAA